MLGSSMLHQIHFINNRKYVNTMLFKATMTFPYLTDKKTEQIKCLL